MRWVICSLEEGLCSSRSDVQRSAPVYANVVARDDAIEVVMRPARLFRRVVKQEASSTWTAEEFLGAHDDTVRVWGDRMQRVGQAQSKAIRERSLERASGAFARLTDGLHLLSAGG